MEHYAGIDVSLEQSSVCVMDAAGRIVREAKVASEPEAFDCLVPGARLSGDTGRAGGGPAVTVAVCGHAAGRPSCRAA